MRDMYSFLTEYFSSVVLVLHAIPGAHRVVGPGTHRGSGPREVHTTASNGVLPGTGLARPASVASSSAGRPL
jgi:hypothetical protein